MLTPAKTEQLAMISQLIAMRTRLSTTGYQLAMKRVSQPQRLDKDAFITMRRAQEYLQAAKRQWP